MKKFAVGPEEEGHRIDVVLEKLMDAYSRTYAQKLIRKGLVTINGQVAKKGNRVSVEDILMIREPALKPSKFNSADIPLDILYEDEDLLVIHKPAGLLTHPSAHERQATLVNALLHHCEKRLSGIGGELRPGIVHRLDKDTSGIMMVAKHDESHRDLAKQIQSRQVEKTYLTLVDGIMASQTGTIEAPLLKTQVRDQHKVVVSPHKDAKDSLTHFEVRRTFDKRCSLLSVQIITGRMHQIRVHMAAIHHPVIGDEVYGNRRINAQFRALGLKRQFLHAWKLKFRHPRTHEWVEFEAPLASDLDVVLENLKQVESD
ncbi:MAG: RluA family pseudouridine synthase [bacterium]|nr:RluA family pseudouridine synthase [bacterium]